MYLEILNSQAFAAGAIYAAVVLAWVGVQKYPVRFLQAHYLILSLSSLAMFLGICVAAWHAWNRYGLERLMCVAEGAELDQDIAFWMSVFHWSKYYEFVDTIIILAKGRPLTFLHVFHHALVVVQSKSWLIGRLSFTWVGVAFNAFVHVIMYYFYFLGASGRRVSWRGRVTQLQIFQFVCSLAVYAYFAKLHYTIGPCQGWAVSWFSIFFNVALLALFVRLSKQKRD